MSLQDTYHLSDVVIGSISLFIRKIFFGELTLEQAEAKIGSILMTTGGGDPNQAKAIVEFIRKDIMTIKPKPEVEENDEMKEEEKPAAGTVSMPLLQALSKYEQLANQLITGERIRIKGQGEAVRPSLLNWIKYYRDELGVGYHDNVQRGQFLFRSENGKHLSTEERERINLVLRSIEENLPVQIDTERSEIVFPRSNAPTQSKPRTDRADVMATAKVEKGPALPGTPAHETPANSAFVSGNLGMVQGTHFGTSEQKASEKGSLSFSSSHVFPAEKEKASNPSTSSGQAPKSAPQTPQAPVSKPNPFRIRPVSLSKKNGK